MTDLIIVLPQHRQEFHLRLEYIQKLLADEKELVLEEVNGILQSREISREEAMKMVWP